MSISDGVFILVFTYLMIAFKRYINKTIGEIIQIFGYFFYFFYLKDILFN
ncbi:hypothetical protein STRA110950_03450 [Streptobacillus ratti]